MAQITVGLDIGTTSIKGVRVARGLRGASLLDHFSHPIASEPSRGLRERQEAALRALAAEGRLKGGDKWVVSVATTDVSLRELELPFTDPRKIDQIVPYEVEGQIPFDLANVVVDPIFLERGGQGGKSRLLVACLPKSVLQDLLSLLGEVGIDPQEVDLSGLALARLYRPYSKSSGGTVLLLEIGASKSILCTLEQGRVLSLRGISIGGDAVSRVIAERLSLSFDDAEKVKYEIDFQNQGDPRSALLREAVEPLVSDIEKSLSLAPRPIGGFLLMGGTSRQRGLLAYLERRLSIPGVKGLAELYGSLDSHHLKGMEEMVASSDGALYQVALGLALPSEEEGLNFRKGEFTFGKTVAERRAQWISIGLILALIGGLFLGNFFLGYRVKAARYQELKTEIRKHFTQAFPHIKTVVQEVDQARSAIEVLKRTEAFLGVKELSPLHILQKITLAIPKGIPIEVHNLVIDSGKVRIEARTDSFESIDRIKGGLSKIKDFRDVTVSDAKVGADPKKVGFRIKFKTTKGKS